MMLLDDTFRIRVDDCDLNMHFFMHLCPFILLVSSHRKAAGSCSAKLTLMQVVFLETNFIRPNIHTEKVGQLRVGPGSTGSF